jgi:hypothetical protein
VRNLWKEKYGRQEGAPHPKLGATGEMKGEGKQVGESRVGSQKGLFRFVLCTRPNPLGLKHPTLSVYQGEALGPDLGRQNLLGVNLYSLYSLKICGIKGE